LPEYLNIQRKYIVFAHFKVINGFITSMYWICLFASQIQQIKISNSSSDCLNNVIHIIY
jgi:hypothetical protein